MAAAYVAPGLIDTDILIDASRGRPDGVQFVASCHTAGTLWISAISAMELVAGCRNKTELSQIQQFLGSATTLPLTEMISKTSLALMESFCLSHGLMLPDALIAATALRHGFRLYSKNIRHFQMIPSLQVDRPY